MSIDTLGYSKYLEEHGLPRVQAEAHAEAANQYLFPQLATKSDLSVLKSELVVAMADLRTDLTRYIVSVAALIIGVIALADGLLFFALKH